MHRTDLLEKLQRYRSKYPDETAETDRYIRFVFAHTDCFERSLLEGHVTGSGWLVNQAGTHVILTHHRKLNRWLQPGGHADGDTDVMLVARKELEEETGLLEFDALDAEVFDLDIHPIPERKGVPEHFHYDARFVFRVTGSEEYVVSEESHDLQWVSIENLGEYTNEESVLRMARKWKGLNA
jgi:8-oxo-dGTP pyrophosphatase MutT (NUDIX family)